MTAPIDQISATISGDVQEQLAEFAAQDAGTPAGAFDVAEIHGNLGSGTHLYRISKDGNAAGDGAERWSYVVKIFDLPGEGFNVASPDPNAWDYWKREFLVYRAPWFQTLAGPLAGPKCLGSGEGADGRLWIAVEDHADSDERPWPFEWFGTVSRHVGEFNAQFLNADARPSEDWLSRNWLADWVDHSEAGIALLPTVADNPLVMRMYPASTIAALTQLWESRHVLYRALDELPQTFCHLDVFPRNVFLVDQERSVAIDWAFAGVGPIGQEVSALVGASLALFEAHPSQADDLESLCLRSYLEGLRAGGWTGSATDEELGYLASGLLRWALGGIRPMMTLLDESMHPFIEAGFGQPIAAVVDVVAQAVDFQVQRIDRLRQWVDF